jgi:hypothetical protein
MADGYFLITDHAVYGRGKLPGDLSAIRVVVAAAFFSGIVELVLPDPSTMPFSPDRARRLLGEWSFAAASKLIVTITAQATIVADDVSR